MKANKSIHKLIEEKIIRRDDLGMFVFDLHRFKQMEISDYEDFLKNPLQILEYYQKEVNCLFGENKLKLINFNDIKKVSELRVEDIDLLCRVNGMISKATKVVAYVHESKWECSSCGTLITTDKDRKPTGCSCGNRTKFFLHASILRDMQEVEIEEPQDELEGIQPQKIRVRLFDDLTDKKLSGILQPGNKVSFLGVVEKVDTKSKSEEAIFEYRLHCIDLHSLDEQFSEELVENCDLERIREISLMDPLNLLVESLAPDIYGHYEIKKAMVLQMVGGVKKRRGKSYSRDRIHILLCGEPGVAKSQLAKNVRERVPKSYYISGDETSKAGLAAIVDRDPLTSAWCLKAGALCKANGSVLVIDELDKFKPEDRDVLHNPMEDGFTTVNKADIHTTLRTDCAILGIANPKNGMFDLDGATIVQQINLPPPLMTRFDLIFIMKDEINKDLDLSIAKRIYSESKESEIDINLFRKYISYAKGINPVLNEENMEELASFYHEIRKKSIIHGSKMRGMPINTRHFEGLIRLSEASAKIRLSERVDPQDIEVAKKIFYDSLVKLGMDSETGILDMARLGQGKTFSKKMKSRLIIEILSGLINEYKADCISEDKLKSCCIEKGISSLEYEDLIHELNFEGEIIKFNHGWKIK